MEKAYAYCSALCVYKDERSNSECFDDCEGGKRWSADE